MLLQTVLLMQPVLCYFHNQLDFAINGRDVELVCGDDLSSNDEIGFLTSYHATVYRHERINFIGGDAWEDLVLQYNINLGTICASVQIKKNRTNLLFQHFTEYVEIEN